MNEGSDYTKEIRRLIIRLAVAFLIIYGLWTIFVIAWGHKHLGAFGDSYGALNAFFSGIALLAVAVTLWQGQKQLKIQQEELQQNTAELKAQREQMEVQNQHLGRQAAQSQFFQMVQSWQQILNGIRIISHYRGSNDPVYISGRNALERMAEGIQNLDSSILVDHNQDEFAHSIVTHARETYENVYGTHGEHLGHYFRLMYHIIRFVHTNQTFDEDDKQNMARILRAHLSQPEFELLLYNGISTHGEAFYPLIEKYDLLQNLGTGRMKNLHHLLMYPKRYRASSDRWEETGPELIKSISQKYKSFYVHAMPQDCIDPEVEMHTAIFNA